MVYRSFCSVPPYFLNILVWLCFLCFHWMSGIHDVVLSRHTYRTLFLLLLVSIPAVLMAGSCSWLVGLFVLPRR